ncbi:TPA_asm: protein 2 [Taxus virus 1]|uniref:Protein 2 n=1 Tax=Taxus virus 1 TaxID=2977994 RepID=A0A9N6YJ52_9RHAB|nr:TPA_asm: protein 2 [Taxus virus 1]
MATEAEEISQLLDELRNNKQLTPLKIYQGVDLSAASREEAIVRAMYRQRELENLDSDSEELTDNDEEHTGSRNKPLTPRRTPIGGITAEALAEEASRQEQEEREADLLAEQMRARLKREEEDKTRWADYKEEPKPVVEDTPLSPQGGQGVDQCNQFTMFNDFPTLLSGLASIGITISNEEEASLSAKHRATGSLSIRDLIMFIEGSRSRGCLSEAKMSTQLDEQQSLIKTLAAQTRLMEKFLTEIKEQERKYMAETEGKMKAKEKSLKNKEDALRSLEREVDVRITEVMKSEKALKKKMKELEKAQRGGHYMESSPVSYRSASPSTSVKREPPPAQPPISSKHSDDSDQGTEIHLALHHMALAMGISLKVIEDYYGMSAIELSRKIRDFPSTEAELEKRFGSVKSAYRQMNIRIVDP